MTMSDSSFRKKLIIGVNALISRTLESKAYWEVLSFYIMLVSTLDVEQITAETGIYVPVESLCLGEPPF